MRADGTFTVDHFTPTTIAPPAPPVVTALPVGVATMEKRYAGEVQGRSTTIFTSAFDPAAGAGTYVAMESFAGTVGGREGAFNFVHAATTTGADRTGEVFLIVPSSGTGALAGITGAGGIAIDADRTHRVWLDYELPDAP
jgi:hypothetical protein